MFSFLFDAETKLVSFIFTFELYIIWISSIFSFSKYFLNKGWDLISEKVILFAVSTKKIRLNRF